MVRFAVAIAVFASLLSVFLWPEAAPAAADAEESNPITVAFRYDDYSAKSDTALEVKLFAAFAEHDVPCLVGVIPYACKGDSHSVLPLDCVPLDQDKAAILKQGLQTGRLEIALHGYSHQTILDKEHGGYTEFRGLDAARQHAKLAQGRAFLERILGVRVWCFVPPWNQYDANTLVALSKLDFALISAGLGGPTLSDETDRASLKYLPATCHLDGIKGAVRQARTLRGSDRIVVVLLHQYDFLENDKTRGKLTLEEFSDVLAWVTSQPDVAVASFGELVNSARDLGVQRLVANRAPRFAASLLPYRFQQVYTVYLGSDEVTQKRWRLWMAFFGLYASALAVAAMLGAAVAVALLHRHRLLAWACLTGGPVVVAGHVVRALRDGYFDAREGLVFAVLGGGYLGAAVALRRRLRRGQAPRLKATEVTDHG